MKAQVVPKAARLRELLAKKTVAIPGAFNALTALQIERAGYEMLYVSGAALSAVRGLPDIGLLSLEEVAVEAGRIARAVSIPTIVDADTGFGPPSAVPMAVRAFEQAGLAGMQIEDQQLPKKCGHLPGKELVPTAEMVSKVRAAVEARSDPDFMIVARTDARAVEGLNAAIQRAQAYVDAGADALFPEALESEEEFERFANEMRRAGVTVPLIANMTEFGKSPYLDIQRFEELGYRGVLFPVTTLRAALLAVEQLLADLTSSGSQRDFLQRMMTRADLYELLRYEPNVTQARRPHE
ncbi:MAG TPA: methylisocitrate lyase [Nitrospiraceae bacterium]|nr:methylisocitrate lyase [Nitrospiraceae bacterium]